MNSPYPRPGQREVVRRARERALLGYHGSTCVILGSAIIVLVSDTVDYHSFAFFGLVFGLLWRVRTQLEMMRLKGRSIRESPWHARWFWWSWWYHRQADEYPYCDDYALPPQG